MKHNKIFLLALSSILLSSCGALNSSSGGGTTTSESQSQDIGEEVTFDEGLVALGQAYYHIMTGDKLAVEAEGEELMYEYDYHHSRYTDYSLQTKL